MASSKSFQAAVEWKRLPGTTREGGPAYWRKISTQDTRRAMSEIIDQYARVIDSFKGITPQAVEHALRPIFHKAVQYTPEKTGALWESGKLTVESVNGKVVGRIQFGDERAWYAALVHEFTWLKHEAPTRSKYLQAALEEELDSLIVSLAVDYSGLFKG